MIKYAEDITTTVKVDYTAFAEPFLHRDDMLSELLNMRKGEVWAWDDEDGENIHVYCEYNLYYDEELEDEYGSASYTVYVQPNTYMTVVFTLTIDYDVYNHCPHIDLTPEDVEISSITL